MENLSKTDLQRLIQVRDQCCISIYMPTHRFPADMEQDIKKSQQAALERYHRSAGTGLTSNDLRQIVPAARHARVDVLFVSLPDQRWGRYDADRNEVSLHEHPSQDSEDLLNLAAVEALLHGGTVYALNPDQLPEPKFPAAALLRF